MSTSSRPRLLLRTAAATAAAGLLAFAAACGGSGETASGGDGSRDLRNAVSLKEANARAAETETETSTETVTETSTDDSADADDATIRDDMDGYAELDDDEAPSDDFALSTQEQLPTAGGLAIEDVRVGSHDGYDRIVIQLSGEDGAGWHVGYKDTPTEQGSGLPIAYPGDNALVVYVHGTGYPFELGVEDLTVGTLKPEKTKAVDQLKGAGMFEGTTEYVVSINGERRPFRVFHLKDPQRIVIDIKTGS